MDSDSLNHSETNPRWKLLRDVLQFQAKLFVDGLRDLLMSPISIGAALAGLLLDREDPARLFRELQQFGRRSERWINLFGRHGAAGLAGPESGNDPSIDELFGHLEQRIVDQYNRGGATATAKHAVDRSLDRVHRGLDRLRETVVEAETRKHDG
jgi:hypothetical protein